MCDTCRERQRCSMTAERFEWRGPTPCRKNAETRPLYRRATRRRPRGLGRRMARARRPAPAAKLPRRRGPSRPASGPSQQRCAPECTSRSRPRRPRRTGRPLRQRSRRRRRRCECGKHRRCFRCQSVPCPRSPWRASSAYGPCRDQSCWPRSLSTSAPRQRSPSTP